MKIYLIPGLGADERVFRDLKLSGDCKIIQWIDPLKGETIENYSLRLRSQIMSDDCVLIGVSFGGVIALELARKMPKGTLILISSVSRHDELPSILSIVQKPILLDVMMSFYSLRSMIPVKWLFGTKEGRLLRNILKDSDKSFTKWALAALASWKGEAISRPFFRLHGTADHIIPLKGDAEEIEGGGHFMIVDQAIEIAAHVNRYIKRIG